MNRLLLFVTVLTCSFSLYAQPTVLGTNLSSGTYVTFDLNDLGSFRQRIFLTTGTSASNRIWEFASGTAAFPDYNTNWRPYSGGLSLAGYNQVIAPNAGTSSANYNTGGGGASGVLPLLSASTNYTVNVTELSAGGSLANEYMAILETSFFPKTIVSVSTPSCIDECGATVTVFLASAPDLAEHVYIRYSTDGFATSSLVEATFSGQTGTATIPGQGAGVGVSYYAYSSNKTIPQIQAEVGTHGQVAHDMLTLRLKTNGSGNFSVSACANYAAITAICQSTVVNLDAGGNAVLLAAAVDGGSSDDCSSVTLAVSPNSFTCVDVGNPSVVLTVSDATGNSASCNASVTVADPTGGCTPPPYANCMDATVELDPTGNYTLLPSEVNNGSSATGGIAVLSVSPNTFDCASITNNDHAVTLLVEDASGNQATCTAAVTVLDKVAPTALCSGPLSVTLDAGATRSLAVSEINNSSSDNCTTPILSVNPSNFNCNTLGDNTVTLTAVDGQGRSSICTTVVNVSDPLLACCAAITPSLTFSSTFTDVTICSGNLPFPGNNGGGQVGRSSSSNAQAIKVDITSVGVLYASNSYTFTQLARSLEVSPLGGSGMVTYVVTAYSFGSNGINNQGGGDDCLGQTETYTVTVEPKPTATVSGGGTGCPGVTLPDVSIALTGTGPWSVTYSDGSTSTTENPVNTSPYVISNPADGTYTVTNVTDLGETLNCSNTGTGSAVALRQDNTLPTAICQDITVDLDASGSYTMADAEIDGGSSDNCNIATASASRASFSCSDISTSPNAVTLTVTDGSGNTAACSAAVTISDPLAACCAAPVALCKPVTVSLDVSLDANGFYSLATSDVDNGSVAACGLQTLSVSPASFDCDDLGSQTVTLTITDVNNKTDDCTTTVEVLDNTRPAITCPANVVLNLSNPPIGPANNNSCTSRFFIQNPFDAGYASDNCEDGAEWRARFDQNTTANPNEIVWGTGNGNNRTFRLGETRVRYTARDASGNQRECSFSVTVIDDIAPTISCPADVTINLSNPLLPLGGNQGTCTSKFFIENPYDAGYASDNCEATAEWRARFNQNTCGTPSNIGWGTGNGNNRTFRIGQTRVRIGVRDASGNERQCSFNVTVVDDVAPVLSNCPANQAVNTDAGQCGYTHTGTAWDATATDNCGTGTGPAAACVSDPTVQNDQNTSASLANVVFSVGATTVTWTATDADNNSASCSFSVTVTDNEAPTMACQPATVQLNANGIASVSAQDVDAGSSDACGIATLSVNLSTFGCSDVGTRTITLTGTDFNNKSATCTASVLVEDKIKPQVTCPADEIISVYQGTCSASDTVTLPSATDNCSVSALEFRFIESDANKTNVGSWTQWTNAYNNNAVFPQPVYWKVQWRAKDPSDNVNRCSFLILVEDNQAPTVACQDLTVSLDANGQVSIPVSNIPLANSSADFNGVQGTNGWQYGMNFATDPGAGFTLLPNWTGFVWNNPGTNLDFPQLDANGGHPQLENLRWAVRRWTSSYTGVIRISGDFYDRDGNCGDGANARIFRNGTQIYEYLNIPTTSVPYSITLNVNAGDQIDFAIDPKFGAGCDDTHFTGNITALGSASSFADNCGISSLSASQSAFDCTDIGTNAVLLTVTDVSGNTTTCSSIVTVEDNLAPVAICQDMTVSLDASGQGSLVPSQLNNGSSDNCGIASFSASQTTFNCSDVGTKTITLTVEDVKGNSSTCNSTVITEDNLLPVAICQDLTVSLDASGQGSLVASQLNNGSSDNCGIATFSASQTTFNCSDVGTKAITLTVEDVNGNSSDCISNVEVKDEVAPTAICQPATVVLSAANGTGAITANDVDGGSSDACGIRSLSVSPSTFDCSMVGDNTVTLTVTDNNGNTAECMATVTVDDSQSKPTTLAQQNCGNCGLLRIFYCQFDPAPASLNAFIDGTVQTNTSYVSGNGLLWYDDNSGSQGGEHMGTGQEPSTPDLNIGNRTYWYWVAQVDQHTGCIGDAIRVRVRVRKTPTPVFSAPSTPYCEGASLNLANQVDDPNNVADSFSFYDADPSNGGTLIGTVTATNGSVDGGQVVVTTPVVGSNTYWVVATNAGNNNSITCPATTSMTFVVSPRPVLSSIADVSVCPGEPVSVSLSATPSSGTFFVWLNSNTDIGLGANGLNTINFPAATNTSGNALVGTIRVRAIVNNCVSAIESFTITVNSDAVIDPSSRVTVCSGQSTAMVLATALGSPAAASYELVSVSLDLGLLASGGNQAPASGLAANAFAGDVFTNTTSGSLTATYSLRATTGDNCTSDLQTVTATILPEPVVTAGLKDTVCSGQATNLSLSTVNALPGTNFSWSPQSLPSGISLISSSSPGTVITDILINTTASPIDVTYDVTATTGNCGSVVVPCTIRVVPFPLVPPTASLSTCEDMITPGQGTFDLTSLDASIGSGLLVNYFTDPNLLNPMLSPAAFVSGNTTVYASVVSVNNTCPNRTDITLIVTNLAVPQVSSSSLPCNNTSQEIIPGAVIGISFNFYDNNPAQGGLLLGSGASYDPMLTTGQSQTFWVTATDGVCESDAVSSTVTVNPAPTATISSNLNNGGICEGDTLELFGSGGGTYSWTGPNGFSLIQQNVRIEGFLLADTGEYILTVSNGLCNDNETLYVVGNRKADAGQNGTLTIAADAQAVDLINYLLGTPSSGGVWAGPSAPYGGDQGTFNPNFMYPGVYTYTLTNPAPCQDSVSIATVTVNVTPVAAAKVRARIYLEGVLDTTNFRMLDSLRRQLLMPTFEPYSGLGYAHVNGGGSESFPVEQLDIAGNDALVDWLYMELRDPSDSTVIVASRSVLLQRDGDVVELDGVSPVCFNRAAPGFYYVVIGHRNHLSVMTGIPVFLNSLGTINLDFTGNTLPVFGTTPQNVTATSVVAGGVHVMIGGDADFNGQIQNSDDVTHWAPFVGGAGYLKADYDCDAQVQNNDRVLVWAPNVGKGTQVPLRSN